MGNRSRWPKGFARIGLSVAVVLIFAISCAYSQTQTQTDNEKYVNDSPSIFLKHLASDQERLWTSPFRFRWEDAEWLAPVTGITTGLILTDSTTEPQLIRPNHINLSNHIADGGLAAYAGTVSGFYLFGRTSGDLRARETGVLAAEAGINSLAIDAVFKYAFRRDRPGQGNGRGQFFQPGGRSFYSAHSTIAWSFASVIASEYPGWLSQTLAYGGASAISMARLTAGQHFPSDVFVGAVTGYLIGKNIYRTRHSSMTEGADYGRFIRTRNAWTIGNAGSTYIPLDNWVYPVLDRLIAEGLVQSQFLGLRPYTRTAAADMVREAQYRTRDIQLPAVLQQDIAVLKAEFAAELQLEQGSDNKAIGIDSLYSRSMYISGPPLNDSYHFGQSVINDYGRPYQQGLNQVAGFSVRAEQGRFAYYFRGEYQHAPGASPYSLEARQVIANADGIPLPPASPIPDTNQFRVVDGYVAMTLAGHSISVGKQEFWWGPDQGDAMIMSNNASPFYTARINRTIPLKLPFILKYLGPVRYDGFFGKLMGHQFPPQPYMHGEKFSFKPTENLELGWSRTAVFAGQGITPLTFGVFWSSLTSTVSSTSAGADIRKSPGVRHGQFDFSYRLPWLRNWVTLYSDSVVHDDVSPVDAPRRAAINPGFYLSHFPKVDKLDLRIEAVNTDPPIKNSTGGRFIYYEGIYRDVYLNSGYLMGSWIGREGKGVQAWTTYRFSPVSSIQASYRNAKIAKDFIPEGETVNDFSGIAKIRVTPTLELSAQLQIERWKAPVLATGLQQDVSTSLQITFWPKDWNKTSSKK